MNAEFLARRSLVGDPSCISTNALLFDHKLYDESDLVPAATSEFDSGSTLLDGAKHVSTFDSEISDGVSLPATSAVTLTDMSELVDGLLLPAMPAAATIERGTGDTSLDGPQLVAAFDSAISFDSQAVLIEDDAQVMPLDCPSDIRIELCDERSEKTCKVRGTRALVLDAYQHVVADGMCCRVQCPDAVRARRERHF